MNNEQIKRLIRNNGLCMWQIARQMGMSEFTLSRWWRFPLTEEQQERILNAINELLAERELTAV